MTVDFTKLPDDLPEPIDDGLCSHLAGMKLPSLQLATTNGSAINFTEIDGYFVIYVYPMIGKPGAPLLEGWDRIPGARGCTPQSCAFRDQHAELTILKTSVYGLSTQTTQDQKEAVTRLCLPYSLVSDHEFQFIDALSLPTFGIAGLTFARRVTLLCSHNIIEKVFYPVFPPNRNACQVVEYLKGK